MLGNLVLFIWFKLSFTSNLAAENLALCQQAGRNEKDEQAAEDLNSGSALLGVAFPNLKSLG